MSLIIGSVYPCQRGCLLYPFASLNPALRKYNIKLFFMKDLHYNAGPLLGPLSYFRSL